MKKGAWAGKGLSKLFWLLGCLVIIGMFIPLVVVFMISFNPGNELVFPPRGLSLRWYLNILHYPAFLSSFQFSIILGVVATVVSLIIGLSGALVLTRRKFRGADIISGLLMSPLVVPQVVIGIGFLSLFSMMHIYHSIPSLLALHRMFKAPLWIFSISLSERIFNWPPCAMICASPFSNNCRMIPEFKRNSQPFPLCFSINERPHSDVFASQA